MVSTTVLTGLFFASAAIATPSETMFKRADPVFNGNWAGAMYSDGPDTFNQVTGVFTIPVNSSTLTRDGAALIAVGIDGFSCLPGSAIFQTGVMINIVNGSVSYMPWCEWYPSPMYTFSGNISFKGGDVIKLTVIATTLNTGTAVIENVTTEEVVARDIESPYYLCQQDAVWLVEVAGSQANFASLSPIIFSNAIANGNIGPAGAKVVDIRRDNWTLTATYIDPPMVVIRPF